MKSNQIGPKIRPNAAFNNRVLSEDTALAPTPGSADRNLSNTSGQSKKSEVVVFQEDQPQNDKKPGNMFEGLTDT